MRYSRVNIFLCFLISFSFTKVTMAQVVDDTKHYQVNHTYSYWGNLHASLFAENPRFQLYVRDDTDNTATDLSNLYPNYNTCHFWTEDGPTSRSRDYKMSRSNTTGNFFDLTVVSFHNDGCSNCGYDCGDNSYGKKSELLALSVDNRSKWISRTTSLNNDSQTRIKSIWRFIKGDNLSDPLSFGTIVSGSRTHSNSVYKSPTAADTDMGYTNQFSGQSNNAADVYYEFKIDKAQRVTIDVANANNSDFDPYIYLLQKDGTVVGQNDNGGIGNNAQFVRDLCRNNLNGIPNDYDDAYLVVVEGRNGDAGDFTITIQVSEPEMNPGMIFPSPSTSCAGDPVQASIFSNQGASTQLLGGLTYDWEKSVNNSGWVSLNQSGGTLFPTDIMPVGNIRYRRKATANCDNTVYAYTDPVTITSKVITHTAGNNILIGDLVIPPGTDPGYLSGGITSPSASPSPHTLIWQKSTNDGVSWATIPGENGVGYDMPVLSETTMFRRGVISSCGEDITNGDYPDAFTNPYTINVYPEDGKISGYVRSDINNSTTGVNGITITVQQSTNLPGRPSSSPDATYTVVTADHPTNGLKGYYEIDNIYYGPDQASFSITPSLQNHEFDPPTGPNVILSNTSKSATRNFEDISTFSVSGSVTQSFEGVDCGLEGVEIKLFEEGFPVGDPVITDANGNWSVEVPIGTYSIQAFKAGSSFSPQSYPSVTVFSNSPGNDFAETSTHTLRGSVLAGCNTYFGQARVRVSDGCFTKEIWTEVSTGLYEIEDLPARPYNVEIINLQNLEPAYSDDLQTILNFAGISEVKEADLSEGDGLIRFSYHNPPSITVTGFPAPPANCGALDFPVLEQATTYSLMIEVFEEGTSCPIDTGMLTVIDQISDQGNVSNTTDFSNSSIDYNLKAGAPNIIYPHLKSISISVADIYGQSIDTALTALVTGGRPREQNFLTTSPELPLLILRDPPGDSSFSFWEKDSTSETATRFYNSDATSQNAWAKVRIGLKFGVEIVGLETETAFWGDNQGSHMVESTNTTANEVILSMTTNERLETSSHPDFIGREGDIFVASALTFAYAISDEVIFDETTCEAVQSKSLVMAKEGEETTIYYTEKAIRESVIPDLRDSIFSASSEGKALFFKTQVEVWEQLLQYNEDLKLEADLVEGPIAISGGLSKTYSKTNTSTQSSTIEFSMEINNEIASELGFEIAGSGVSGGLTTNFKMETGNSETTTVTEGLTTGYTLNDAQAGDLIRLNIREDKVYKTPVFEVLEGQTSCPAEEGTNARDALQLSVDPQTPAIQSGLAPTDAALFTLKVGNISESDEDRDNYFIRVKPGSNLSPAALIKIGGSPFTTPQPLGLILVNGEASVDVSIERGTSPALSFEGIEFEAYSDCDPDVSSTTAVSVFFQSPCSDISLDAPGDDWVISQSNNNELPLLIKDYDLDNLDQVNIQYAAKGTSAWISSANVAPVLADSPFGTQVLWDVSNIPDGEYHLRLELLCGSNAVYSSRATGLIDRTPPNVFGIPQPNDDNYQAGDEISVYFSEPIAENVFDNNSLTLKKLYSEEVIPAQLDAVGNQIVIIPGIDLSNLLGEPVQVEVNGVQDIYGNPMNESVRWKFTIGGDLASLDFDMDGVIDPKDKCPGFNDSIDGDGDGLPDACDFCSDRSGAGLDFDGVDDYLSLSAINQWGNNGPATVEAWVYIDELPTTKSWLLQLGQEGAGAQLWTLNADATMDIGVWGGTLMQPAVLTNRWMHLATVYDGTKLTLYINGFKYDELPATFNYTLDQLRLAFPQGADEYFDGKVDEVRIWNIARTQADISTDMEQELIGNESGLLLYYNFNEGIPNADNSDISEVPDQTYYGNNASLSGFEKLNTTSNWVVGAAVQHLDIDGNGIGEICQDTDSDGIVDRFDRCPGFDDTIDADGDGLPDGCDNCPNIANVALDFDGVDDFVTTPQDVDVDVLPVMTWEAWFYPTSPAPGFEMIMSSDDGSWDRFVALYDNHIILGYGLDAHYYVAPYSLNEWQHIALVFNQANNELAFYKDGAFVNTFSTAFQAETTLENLTIGATNSTGSNLFSGRLDEVRIWNTERSPEQLASNRNQELLGTETGLVAHYNFNEGTPNQDNTSIAVLENKVDETTATPNNFSQDGLSSNWVMGAPILLSDQDEDGIGDACEVIIPDFSVTLQVDMRNQSVSSDGVHVAGSFQSEAGYPSDWNPGTTMISDTDGDGIYEITLTLDEVEASEQFQYKFINGNSWGSDETVPEDCGVLGGAGTYDRYFTIPDDGSTSLSQDVVCFEECTTCQTTTSCSASEDLGSVVLPSETYSAAGTLNSSNIIEGGSVVTFTAGTSITLSAGFHAQPNATFTARIWECQQQATNNDEGELDLRTSATPVEETARLHLYPNPARTQVNVAYTLQEAGSIYLEVRNSTGQVVRRIENGNWKSKGEHIQAFGTSQLHAGMYFISLHTVDQTLVKKLIILQ